MNKDNHYLRQAVLISERSKDNSTKVGAIIIDPNGRVVSQGYNGFPRGCNDDYTYLSRKDKLHRTIHSEMNAVLFAQCDLADCTIYVSLEPCSQCMAVLAQVGIKKVVAYRATNEQYEQWKSSFDMAKKIADEAEIDLDYRERTKCQTLPYVPKTIAP